MYGEYLTLVLDVTGKVLQGISPYFFVYSLNVRRLCKMKYNPTITIANMYINTCMLLFSSGMYLNVDEML